VKLEIDVMSCEIDWTLDPESERARTIPHALCKPLKLASFPDQITTAERNVTGEIRMQLARGYGGVHKGWQFKKEEMSMMGADCASITIFQQRTQVHDDF
jgi:hypothetical protein